MNDALRAAWDAYYQAQAGQPLPAPEPLLFEAVPPPFAPRLHRALDVGCGRGQNALWLAEQGYEVDAIDISRVALSQGRAEAQARAARAVNWLWADANEVGMDEAAYDLAVACHFITDALPARLRAALRPGGRVIVQAFVPNAPDQPPAPQAFTLERGALVGVFADWQVLYHVELRGLVQVVAQKPS